MREIKFRAWHKELKGYYYFDLYDVFCAGEYRCLTQDLKRPMTCFNINHKPFEQYTGLKNLYENDVIQDNIGIGVVEYKNEYAGFRVNYKNGRCKWFYDSLESEMKTIEIIGNIHENPNLLGGESV